MSAPAADTIRWDLRLDGNVIERSIGMQSKVTEIAPGTYRISTFHPDYKIQFNQFLIEDDEPFLMHTGFKRMFQSTLEGVASIMDPAKLRWIGFSHFESDECGALNEWLGTASRAQAVCSFVGAMVMVNDFADRAARPLADGEVLQTGKHCIRFLSTPHVPHSWDAGLFFDETERAPVAPITKGKGRTGEASVGAVVFGSDQGLVGQFNDVVADFAVKALAAIPGESQV